MKAAGNVEPAGWAARGGGGGVGGAAAPQVSSQKPPQSDERRDGDSAGAVGPAGDLATLVLVSPWGWRWLIWLCPPAGPSHWKELKATCGGSKQSPVNIDRRRLQRDSGLGDIVFEGYDQAPPGKWRLVNNGHTGGCSAPTMGLSPHAGAAALCCPHGAALRPPAPSLSHPLQ